MAKKKESLTVDERIEKALVPKEEQPYEIPSNWVWTRLGEVSEINPKKDIVAFKDEEHLSFIPMKAVSEITKSIDSIEYESYSKLKKGYTQFRNEDIIFAKITPCMENGKLAIVKGLKHNTGYGSTEFHVIRSSDSIKNTYIYYFVSQQNFRDEARYNMTGSVGFLRVPADFMKTYAIPLPPLEEQKRIVKKVESMLDKIKEAKEIINDVREKALLRKESLLNKAFTGELTSKWRSENETTSATKLLEKINDEKLKKWEEECKVAESEGKKKSKKPALKTVAEMIVPKEEEPYEIPSNWVWTRLGEVVIKDIKRGKSPKYIEKSEILVFAQKCNTKYMGINMELAKCLDPKLKEKYLTDEYMIIEDIVINSTGTGTMGRVGFYNIENNLKVVPDSHVTVVRVSSLLVKKLFYFIIKSKQEFLETNGDGSTNQIELKPITIQNIIIPLPPLEEQKEIVRILDDVLEKEREIEELCNMEENLELLEKSILDKAFRGELGTNSTDDESAIELLRKMYSND